MADPVTVNHKSVLELLARRWSLPIIELLEHESLRFSELKRCIVGVSQRMLSLSTNDLVEAGFVERLDGEVKRYALSARGKHVLKLLKPLRKFLEESDRSWPPT